MLTVMPWKPHVVGRRATNFSRDQLVNMERPNRSNRRQTIDPDIQFKSSTPCNYERKSFSTYNSILKPLIN